MSKTSIDINEVTIQKYVETLRPEDDKIRKELDFGYTYDGKVAIVFEIRPRWDDPSQIQQIPFLKIRYYKSLNCWKLYWMRASGKWELYEPFPSATHLNKILKIVEEDKHGCFYG
jgi:hypothetical protein